MPTIDTRKAKDGTISYRVRVQKKGYPTQTATFPTLRDARRWGAMVEGQIVEHRHFPTKDAHTLSDLITRYADDVLPRKRPETQRREAYILAFWRQRLGQKLLTDITK